MAPPQWTHTGYTQRLYFGVNTVDRVSEIAKDLGARRLMLVTTGVAPPRRRARRSSPASAAPWSRSSTASVPPSRTIVRRHAERRGKASMASWLRRRLLHGPREASISSRTGERPPGNDLRRSSRAHHIAIPTTYSGAECTPFFGMTDERSRAKTGGGGPSSAPIAVIYDPLLTLSTPASVSAETAFNALAHCVEGAYAINRTAEAEAIALAGAAQIVDALPRVVDTPDESPRAPIFSRAARLPARCRNVDGRAHGLAPLSWGHAIAHSLANASSPARDRFTPSRARAMAPSDGDRDPF